MNKVENNTSALLCAIRNGNDANAMVLIQHNDFDHSIVDVITLTNTTVLYEALVNGMQNTFRELVNGRHKVSKKTVKHFIK